MRRRGLNGVMLGIVLLTSMGAICTGPCAQKFVYVDLVSLTPTNGPVPGPTVTIVAEVTEDSTDAVCYILSFGLDKWNPVTQGWQWAGVYPTYEYGEAGPSPSGECGEIRTITVTFADLPLTAGENKYRFETYIDGCDGWEDTWETYEVTYTYTP
ncbi:MAG: hypothetical protein JXQ73_10960 [Phycisphaerae bacterium]|nr:hypothetical protein [Phycisphaerae bacterium]